MSKPTSRLFAALELLQSRRRVTGAELAERLQVDRRTVRRYVATLAEMGIPFATERGRDGAYLLTSGFKLPPMMFTDDEALALSMGLVATREMGLANTAPAIASALAKLERVMPEPLKQRVRAIDETVRLDMRRTAAVTDGQALAVLSAAAQRRQRVQLVYRTPQLEVTQREIDPYGLAYYVGRWYAVGHCHLRRGLRSFRLDRVQSVAPIPASFGRPDGFDALQYIRHSISTLPREHSVSVLLHTDLATAQQRLFTEIGMLEYHAHTSRRKPMVLLRSEADDLDWFARELARFPFRFEVLAPSELARRVERHAKQLLQCVAR
ncbi:MAG TPA: YafY family protein [Burkholderiaceae bacterium]|nr:YafY family protein [Burkholderiaceae bacterium]